MAARDLVAARPALRAVVADTGVDEVVSRAALDDLVAEAGEVLVVTGAADDQGAVAEAAHLVVARAAEHARGVGDAEVFAGAQHQAADVREPAVGAAAGAGDHEQPLGCRRTAARVVLV